MQTLIKNQEMLDQLVKFIPEDSITGFQLKDIVRENLTFDDIKKALTEKIEDKSYLVDPRISGDMPSDEDEKQEQYDARKEAEKEAKMGFPTISPTEILKQANVEDRYEWKWKGPKKCGAYEQIKELKIDNETFWTLDEGQLESLLHIKDFGTKKTLAKLMKDTKD